MSKMAASQARQQKIIPSTLPNNKPICLPPLDSPPCAEGVPVPVVYTVRLPEDVGKALVASTDTAVTFETDTEGLISISGIRNVPFKAQPVTDVNNETARATCFSRRETQIRTVGPILADIELVENRPPNYNPKKRAFETAVHKRPEIKPLEEVTVSTPPGKRQRTRTPPVEKRARPSSRRSSLSSQPVPPYSAKPLVASKPVPSNNPRTASAPSSTSPPSRPSAQNGFDASRLPLRSAPASSYRSPVSPNISSFGKPSTSGAPLHLRSAPIPQSSASAAPSMHPTLPHLKMPVPIPAHNGPTPNSSSAPIQSSLTALPSRRPIPPNVGNGQHNMHTSSGPVPPASHGMAKRRTPTRSSLTAMRSRNISPPMSASALPHPAMRRAPTTQYSPYASRASSPKAGSRYYAYNGSPASPRVPSTVRPDQRAELRRHVVHMLAAGDCSLDSLRKRLKIDNAPSMGPVLSGVLKEVANRQSGVFSLRQSLWRDVSDGYECYSDVDLAAMRMRRSTMAGPNFEHTSPNPEGMTDAQLDKKISEFEKTEMERRVNKPCTPGEEKELRQQYQTWYSTYRTIIGRMEEMRRTFVRLEERYASCQKPKDKEALVQQIKRSHDRFFERKKRFEKVLPALHVMLKCIRDALEGVQKSSE